MTTENELPADRQEAADINQAAREEEAWKKRDPEFQPITNDMTKKIDSEIAINHARLEWVANHMDDPRANDDEWVNAQLDKINEHYRVKTQAEVIDLINQWDADPIWDLENSEGFEMHHDALLAVRLAKETEWKQKENDRLLARAGELGCSIALVKHLEQLEWKLEQLEKQIERVAEAVEGEQFQSTVQEILRRHQR
jgi:hypothetical protein